MPPRPWIRIDRARPRCRRSGSRSGALPARTSWTRSSGGAPVGQAEEALEADRQVEVAARPEAPLVRKASRPESRPSRSASQVPRRCRSRRRPRARGEVADLAALAAQLAPPRCGRRPRAGPGRSRGSPLGAQVALGERGERLLDPAQPCSSSECASIGQLGIASGASARIDRLVRRRAVAANSMPRVREVAIQRHPERRAARARAARARRGRDLCLRPDRLQPHPHRQRAALRRLLAAASASSRTRATSASW